MHHNFESLTPGHYQSTMAAQALEFVKKCTLATKLQVSPLCAEPVPAGAGVSTSATQHADYAKQGFVCGGSTVSFTEHLKGQQKSDVLNSTLFAQLVADAKHSRETPEWYKEYVQVLGNIGYEIEGLFKFENFDCKSPTFTMHTVVLNVLKGLATDDEIRLKQSIFDAMKAVENVGGKHVELFDDYSKTSSTHGGFQIFPCTTDSNNNVLLILGAFYFTSAQHGNNILFFDYNTSSTSLFTAGQKCHLKMHIYDYLRHEVIVTKLGDRAKTDVAHIPLSIS